MRYTLLAIVAAALLPASIALAEQSSHRKPDRPAGTGRLLPLKGAAGTETCVKIGGSVGIGVGGSRGIR
jgi:hypothetical protein